MNRLKGNRTFEPALDALAGLLFGTMLSLSLVGLALVLISRLHPAGTP